MINVTTQDPRPLSPFANPYDMTLAKGGVIDWSRVSSFYTLGKFTVTQNGGAAVGAVTVAVDALEYALPKGTVLDFGDVTGFDVELSGNEAIGQTAISVVALTAPLPSGAILYFGTGEFMKLTAPGVIGDTTLTVEALEVAIESGDKATYKGGKRLVSLTSDVAAGAVSLPCQALEFAIANDATAIADKTGAGDGRRIPQGTVMARTSGGKLIPRREATNETAIGFLVSDAYEKDTFSPYSGYGLVIGNTVIYENLLPDAVAGDLSGTYKTELGTGSLGFIFTDWADDRV